MIRDRILDYSQQLFLGVGGTDRESVEELDHQTSKPLERSGNANGGVHFNQDPLRRMDVDLELARLVDGGVEESEETLAGNQ